MAERELGILIRARDMASRTVRGVRKEVGRLGSEGVRGIKNLSANMVRLGAVTAVGLVGALAAGTRSLGHLQRVTGQTEAVIKSTGGAAGVTADQVRTLAEELENVTTADDKLIQEGQNLLLTFTGIGKEAFPQASKAMVDMAIAMNKGQVEGANFGATALQIGKALNDPVRGFTALRRAGVSFTKDQEAQIKAAVKAGNTYKAQRIILGELEKEFGEAGRAAGQGPEAAFRRLEDAGESVTQALAKAFLPVLERASKWLTTKLSDPKVIAFFEQLGEDIADAADAALRFVEGIDWNSVGAGVKQAGDIAKQIVGLFMGLPPWVKTAIISGWGLNKLTGGALSSMITGLAGGLIKGVLGMNAGVVNARAGVVNVAGGVGGPGMVGGKGGKGGVGGALGLVSKVFLVGAAAGVAAELWGQRMEQSAQNVQMGQGVIDQTAVFTQTATLSQMQRSLAGIEAYDRKLSSELTPEAIAYQLNIDGVKTVVRDQIAQLRAAVIREAEETHGNQDEGTRAVNLGASITNSTLRQTKASVIEAGLKAQRAGEVAKAGGVEAAVAIRNKDLSVQTTNNIRITQPIRVSVNSRMIRSQLTSDALVAKGPIRVQS